MDSLKLEMSGSLKELHYPYEKLVSGILNGGELKTKDHLKFVCTFSDNLLLSTCLCRQKCNLKHPLFCPLLSVPELGAPGSSYCEAQTRHRESTGRKSGVSGASVNLHYTEYPRAQRTGHSRSFLSSPREGGTDEFIEFIHPCTILDDVLNPACLL